ncbi:MAG: hypothetical protein KJ615_09405, partial [Bacteroidetes bacterium]|nr:hypothetical protein [Bacteroidota bacterium]
MKNLLALFGVILFFALSVSSCSKDPEKPDVSDDLAMEDLTVSASFNWSTTRGARFEITTLDNQDNPIAGVKLEVLSADPEDGGKLIVSGVTDSQGLYVTDYQVPAYYSSLFVATDYLGLVNLTEVELDASGFQLVLGGSTVVPSFKSALVPKAANAVYKFMGG